MNSNERRRLRGALTEEDFGWPFGRGATGKIELLIDPRQPIGRGAAGGLAVFYDPQTMAVVPGSPYGLRSKQSAAPAASQSARPGVPRALTFLGW